jgi:dTDP-4-dehydrorhamnose reductase
MRIAVTGAAGLLGQGLVRELQAHHLILPLTRANADITDRDAICAAITAFQPDLVIHTAAARGLDWCETHPEAAKTINIGGTKNVLRAAAACAAGFAFISSDAVFSGEHSTPYREYEIARPCSVYARTKFIAERIVSQWPRHHIFRVSVLFGPGKGNYIEEVLRAVAAGRQYAAATDQIGSATYTPDAAGVIGKVVEHKIYGLFHLCSPGIYSRREIARLAVSIAGLDPAMVVGKLRDQLGGIAKRSEYSGMKMQALQSCGISLPRPVDQALAEYIPSLSLCINPQASA